ncbi:hypothetical protein B0H13DRAFT_2679214 [Mycena leptocephala]|nr:hypothetical protein B0H13DRAFT_2679214 [Mycena leptocephala]
MSATLRSKYTASQKLNVTFRLHSFTVLTMISTARSTPKTRFECYISIQSLPCPLTTTQTVSHPSTRHRPLLARLPQALFRVDPPSALRVLIPPLLALPTHFFLPSSARTFLSLQDVGNPFTPFFLLSHPTPAPERLSAALMRPELVETTQLYQRPRRPRAARIQRCPVLVPAAHAQS